MDHTRSPNLPGSCQVDQGHSLHSSTNLSFSKVKHTFREANSTADFLSKDGHNTDETQHFYTYHQLLATIKGSYVLEKMG
ncbi:hypothetical protein H5410_064086 [Solanum commersonii]|uniref:RNase H type-1 domain-containing protein n=1 Tax=Solanum commersonii TaxID=4109 RepID=A0A9J5W0J5_SOLCO|nr:hypothetical protein H5410_064086 [Solanum commersonii]